MAASVGNISIGVVANTSGLTKGLNKAKSSVKGFGSKMAGMAKGLTAFLGPVALAAAAIGVLVKVFTSLFAAFGEVDRIAKLSKAMKVSTETLISWEHGAKKAGASIGDITTGLRKLQKNVSDAGLGLTTAVRAFDTLGLSAENLKKQSPEEQFTTVAEALSKMTSQTDKVRVAQDLFGRSGAKLLPFLDGGAEGLRKMREEADRLGITFSAAEAEGVEKFNDSMADLKAVAQGVFQKLAIALAPALAKLVKWIETAVLAVIQFSKWISKWRVQILLLMGPVGWLSLGLMKLFGLLDETAPIDKQTGAMKRMAEEATAAREPIDKLMESLRMESANIGLSKAEKTLKKLRGMGGSKADIAEAKKLLAGQQKFADDKLAKEAQAAAINKQQQRLASAAKQAMNFKAAKVNVAAGPTAIGRSSAAFSQARQNELAKSGGDPVFKEQQKQTRTLEDMRKTMTEILQKQDDMESLERQLLS